MKYNVVHVTRYAYAETATLCHNQAHLTPRETSRQRCISCKLEITPGPAMVESWLDAFGNTATYFTIEQSHRELSVVAKSQVEVLERTSEPKHNGCRWEDAAGLADDLTGRGQIDPAALVCSVGPVANSEGVREYAAATFTPNRPLFDAVRELTERIYNDFKYDSSATVISTPPAEILSRRRGVCQDFANLQIACLRSHGLAARYVSGYLVTRPPPGKPRLVGADASHAWVSVYFPEAGWIDFDPTNNRLTGMEYITLAWGRDYADVSPVRGVFLGGGAHYMNVSVDVAPIGASA